MILIQFARRKDVLVAVRAIIVGPVQCNELKVDEEGFDYPIIELEKYIDCRKCQDVCPLINPAIFPDDKDITVYV